MRAIGQAGMLAAILFAPACGPDPQPKSTSPLEPLRRATFRTLAARDFFISCPRSAVRGERVTQIRRLDILKQLAVRKKAGRAVWLGENDWAGVSRYSEREPCAPGQESYREALAAFSGALDDLAHEIATYRE